MKLKKLGADSLDELKVKALIIAVVIFVLKRSVLGRGADGQRTVLDERVLLGAVDLLDLSVVRAAGTGIRTRVGVGRTAARQSKGERHSTRGGKCAKYDVSIAAITDTPEREKEVTFSDSYYMDDQAIVTKVDNTDITADNYSEKLNNADATIIVQSGSTAEAFAQENFPKAKIVPYKDATECFSALQSDKGDAVVTNRSVASQLTAEQFNTCQTIKQISTGEEYAIAINQGNTKLKDDINQAIKDLTDDGTVDALMAKYNIK